MTTIWRAAFTVTAMQELSQKEAAKLNRMVHIADPGNSDGSERGCVVPLPTTDQEGFEVAFRRCGERRRDARVSMQGLRSERRALSLGPCAGPSSVRPCSEATWTSALLSRSGLSRNHKEQEQKTVSRGLDQSGIRVGWRCSVVACQRSFSDFATCCSRTKRCPDLPASRTDTQRSNF